MLQFMAKWPSKSRKENSNDPHVRSNEGSYQDQVSAFKCFLVLEMSWLLSFYHLLLTGLCTYMRRYNLYLFSHQCFFKEKLSIHVFSTFSWKSMQKIVLAHINSTQGSSPTCWIVLCCLWNPSFTHYGIPYYVICISPTASIIPTIDCECFGHAWM